jgi:hypothetical protein
MGAYALRRGKKLHYPKKRVDRAGDARHAQHRGSIVAVVLSLGEVSFNHQSFWQDISRSVRLVFSSVLEFVLMLTIDRLSDLHCSSLKEETQVARTPRSCEGQYKGVMDYYCRKRGAVLGRNYRFAEILEEAIPLDDELQPTKRTMKKKSKASRSNRRLRWQTTSRASSQRPSAQPVLVPTLPCRPRRRARANGKTAHWWPTWSWPRDIAWRTNQEAQIEAWHGEAQQLQAQDEQWRAEMTSMVQGLLNIHHRPPTFSLSILSSRAPWLPLPPISLVCQLITVILVIT